MVSAELPSRRGAIELIEEHVRRVAVPGGFSTELRFVRAEDLVRQEESKGVKREMEAGMIRTIRDAGLSGDLYFFLRTRGNGWPGQPIGLPMVIPRGGGDDFFCGVYMPGVGEKKEDAQKIMNALNEAEKVQLPNGMEKHFVDGFLVITQEIAEYWAKEKKVFFEPAQMNSPLHSAERLEARRVITDEISHELMRDQMIWALRAIGMLSVTGLSELAEDKNKPFRRGGAVNLALWPYINANYNHLSDWLLERDPNCVFAGTTVGKMQLDACKRPLPMGAFDSIHPMARRMSSERSGVNLHHILPRKGLILEMYNFIMRNNIPPDFSSRELIAILSYIPHGEYMDMTKRDNAILHTDMREVDLNMTKNARLMEATMNDPANIGRTCEECHYGMIHYDTDYQGPIAALMYDIEMGRVRVTTDEGHSRGNVGILAERVLHDKNKYPKMKPMEVFKWLQLSRLLVAESGRLFVHEQTANLMLRLAASKTKALRVAHTDEEVNAVVKKASLNGNGKRDMGDDVKRALESTPYPVPMRRPKKMT